MSEIVTDADIKTLLGINGTSQDAAIGILNEAYTDLLFEIIGVQDLLYHDVEDERAQTYNCEYIYLNEFPVDPDTIVLKTIDGVAITGYYFRADWQNNRKIWLVNEDGNPKYIYHSEVRVNYSAGYAINEGEEEEEVDASANIPKAFKMAVALMVGGGLAEKQKKGGITEYRIGSKMVKFKDGDDSNQFQLILKKYLAKHIKPVIVS